ESGRGTHRERIGGLGRAGHSRQAGAERFLHRHGERDFRQTRSQASALLAEPVRMVIIKRGQLAFEPIDAVEKKLVSIGGDDETPGHRKPAAVRATRLLPLPPTRDTRPASGSSK